MAGACLESLDFMPLFFSEGSQCGMPQEPREAREGRKACAP